ncbi:HAMP domain-containing histidine kinase [Clostridium estertheticum]|uniref:sensor histidine kinase n=1 Tax=Clostridium estertheticum TaxID=238834 RepID=UPI0013EE87EB|nr:HAMP domain-containing sensor histidine kinase [Clostridium estertheticum]MBZ9607882.1 HAMP domain-containing histidine kinase [Clostridium estertheticum]
MSVDIKKEPLFKKLTVIVMISVFIMGTIFLGSQYYFINKLYNSQFQINQTMVGTLTSMYPENEVEIVKAVIDKSDDKYNKSGQDILAKYGYHDDSTIAYDKVKKEYFFNIITYDIIIIVVISMIVIALLWFTIKYFFRKIDSFSLAVDEIMKDNYSFDMNDYDQGILSRLNFQFKQMSKKLESNITTLEAEKENIKSLVTDISHQLKTPVSSIKLFNQILLEDDISSSERIEFLTRSESDINSLEWLVGSLVKLSRLEVGMINIKMHREDLKNTILKAINEIYFKAEEKNIEIIIGNFKNMLIDHDTNWTKEAVFNVLENAVKYTNEGGKISVDMIEMESFIRIDIEDSGIGISENEMSDVYKRFYRGKSKGVQVKEGSGVGLYLTRKILEIQGGSIILTSRQGEGTVFNFFLQKC